MAAEVPSGWRRCTFGDVLEESDERCGMRIDLPVLSVTKARGPMLASERFSRQLFSRNLSPYRVARRLSIVLDPMLLWDGSIGLQDVVDEGLVSPDYRVYRCLGPVDPRFIGYLVREPGAKRHYQTGARGTNVRRNRIARTDFRRIPLLLPPLTEQREITSIISSLDETIERIEDEARQLQLMKSSLLRNLMTGGGRDRSRHRTELGSLPTDWGVIPLAEAGMWLSGGTPSKADPDLWRGEIPWVSPKDMKVARIGDSEDHVSEGAVGNGTRVVPAETLLMVVRGMILAHSFPVAITTGTVAFNQDIKALIVRKELVPEFMLYWLQFQKEAVLSFAASATHGTLRIPTEDLFQLCFPCPPKEEQRKIVSILGSVDDAADAFLNQVVGLRKAKAALVSGLLSGAVRVTPEAVGA